MGLLGGGDVALLHVLAQLRHLSGAEVGSDRHNALGANGHEGDDEGVIAREDLDVTERADLCGEVDRARRLLDRADFGNRLVELRFAV